MATPSTEHPALPTDRRRRGLEPRVVVHWSQRPIDAERRAERYESVDRALGESHTVGQPDLVLQRRGGTHSLWDVVDASRQGMNSRHPLAFRVKGQLEDPRERGLEIRLLETALAGDGDECRLRGVTDQGAIVGDCGVVAQRATGQ